MSATHPAIPMIQAGQAPRAIEYLKALNDPRLLGALAMLENGCLDYAQWILEDLPPHVMARAPKVAA